MGEKIGGSMTKVKELDNLFGYEEEEEEEEEQEGLTPEEEAEEKEGLAEAKAEELKTSLATKYGIDPDSEADLLQKIVDNELSHREKLSKTIKQKISWREKAGTKKPGDQKPPAGGKPNVLDADAIAALIDSKVAERLDGEKLKSLDLPDTLQSEVREIAKIRGISIGEAAKLPYILTRIDEVKQEERIKNATPGRNNNSSHQTSIDPSKPLNPSDFDLSSDEGRKAWNDAKASRRDYEKKHE